MEFRFIYQGQVTAQEEHRMTSSAFPSQVAASPRTERVAVRRLLWIGPLAIVASTAVNLIIRAAGLAVFDISPEFLPLASASATIMFTAIGVLAATITFAVISRLAKRPVRVFQIVAAVALALSLVPDVLFLVFPSPGTSVQAVAILMIMHVAAAIIAVSLLTRLSRAA
jgi:hypothetical protein